MAIVLLILAVLALFVLPSFWVNAVMQRYRNPPNRYPRTGGQTARELLDSLGLKHVTTEITDKGDHYDPLDKAVRLSADNYNGRSLTALTVAAHEVGHAVQDARAFAPLRWRTQLVRLVAPLERLGAAMLMLAPFAAALARAPRIGLIGALAGAATLFLGIVVHMLTLPTELDASFGRALPLLKQRRLLHAEDMPKARMLLTAAAFTYVAVAAQSLLSIARWWAILRR